MSLIGRMILFDLIKITLLSVGSVSGLFVLVGAMFEANRYGMDPQKVILMLPLLIPPTLPYTLPISVLFACTFVYGRLTSNQELVAIKAGGVHVMRILYPALFLGIVLSAVGVYIGDQFIPACHRRMNQMLVDDLTSSIYAYLRQTGAISKPDFPYEIFVQDVRDGKLIKPTFKHRAPTGQYDLVGQAEEATLTVTQASYEEDSEPIINIRLMEHKVATPGGLAHVRDQTYQMPVPEDVGRREVRLKMLSCLGCENEAQNYVNKSRLADFDVATTGAWTALQGDLVPWSQMVHTNRYYAERESRKSREMQAEVHGRLAQAVSCLLFVLLGCPVGMLFQRRDFLQTFFVCFLPITTIYYPSLILARNIVKEDMLPAWISLWAPTILMTLFALPLIRRVIIR